jgi:hypothetical protein
MPSILVVGLSLLAIGIAAAGALLGFVRPTALPLRIPVLLAFSLPYAAVLALYFRQPLRGYAFTLAAGSALVVALALGLYAAMLLVFIGFTMGNRDQLALALATPAYVLVQIPLGISAVLAWRRLPATERPPRAWAAGLVLPVAWAALVFGAYQWHDFRHRQSSGQARANDAAAATASARAVACLAAYRDAHGGSFPPGLDAVAPCLGDAASAFPGYRVLYAPALPDERGRIGFYSLCAEAEQVGRTGWHTYVADEDGPGPAYAFDYESLKAPGCAGAWGADLLRRVKHCVAAWAARAGGYPPSLVALGEHGDRCLTREGDLRGLDPASVALHDRYAIYRAGPPGPGGRVTRFELSTSQREGNATVEIMVDETGARHASAEGRAGRADPPPAEVRERLAARAWEAGAELDALARRCAEGSAADCALLGYRRYRERDDDAGALAAWGRACALENAEGCLFVESREQDRDVFGLALSDRGDCLRDEADACRRLARLAAHYPGCRHDDRPGDCAEIAYRHARGGDTARANRIWEAACEKRHKESCLLWKTRDFDYVRVFRLKDRCVSGEDAACAELAKLAEVSVSFE